MPNLTQGRLAALRPDQSTGDAACRGLRAARNRDGTTRFMYRWRTADGTLRQRVIGDAAIMPIADARAEVERLREVRRTGADPAQALAAEHGARVVVAEQGIYTVRKLIDDYYADKLAATAGGKERKRLLTVDLDDWMRRPAASITRLDVQNKIDAIAGRGAADTAGRVLRELRRAIERAVVKGRLADDLPDPCRGVELPAASSYVARERAFSATEWKSWLRWLPRSGFSDDVQDALWLAALTAQRTGEVVAMKWTDLHGTEWRVADRKIAGEHTVFLSEPARAVLAARKRLHGASPFVFPSPAFDDRAIRQHALVWAISNARAECPVQGWTAHDIRRSGATLLQSKGVTLPVLSRVLGHYARGRGATAIYARHTFNVEARAAWTLLAKTLTGWR